jgi:signal transduction histidine kinase
VFGLRSFDSFRRQEIALIKLSLAVIATLGLIHLSFGHKLGYPSRLASALLVLRFVEQVMEWVWLNRRVSPLSAGQIRFYSFASPAVAILFAFVVNAFSGMEDAHYHVLMVIPIIACGFRFRFQWVVLYVALAGALTVSGVLVTNDVDDGSGLQELFEASTDVLIYALVGGVVWVMSEHLRRDSEEIGEHYDRLQLMQERLSKDERLAAVGRFASAIAHEIRNPVAAIVSSLAAAEDPGMPAAIREEMSRIAAKESGRLEKLTSDFLAYARVKPPELRLTDVGGTVSYVASLITAKASESSVLIKTRCGTRAQTMMDEFQMHGALLNVAMNAIEASPGGATVEIGVNECEQESGAAFVEIYVLSAGEAIPANLACQIFEPFFTTKAAGTGLGLAIARNIAVAHGGTLELTDNRSGHVRFTLTIPLIGSEKPQRAAPERAEEKMSAPSKAILAGMEIR